MPTIQIKTDVIERLQQMHALGESATARAIGCDRATLRRIKDGTAPSAAFIAGCVLLFQVPVESMFTVVDEAHHASAA